MELGSPFTFIDEQSGLPGTGYTAFLDNDNLYLGTNTGLYVKSKNSLNNFSIVPNTLGQVYHIGRYGDDLLLGHHSGAYRIENNGARQISTEPGAWVFQNLKGSADKLIGGIYAGCYCTNSQRGQWKMRKTIPGFGESSRVMEEDQQGNLWVTHGYKRSVSFNAQRCQG